MKTLLTCFFTLCFAIVAPAAPALLELKPGDNVAIVGGALADRMQHHGWLESFIHAKHPNHKLVFRNLAVSGDEVATWHRSENFGSRNDWLGRVKADVVLAFYGYNESFKGEAGLVKFKQDLEKFLKEAQAANFNGKGAPKLVLISAIAQEKHTDPDLPDPTINNVSLKSYTAAMAAVAKTNGVPFVDLFAVTEKKSATPLTMNGHFLTEAGDKVVASAIYSALFGAAVPAGNIEKLRAAVLDKNKEWHARYRTVDGFNVYGGRSKLSFPTSKEKGAPKITNFDVMQQEMAQRDGKTANREQRVWAVAKGGDLKVDDANLPTVSTFDSNRPDIKPFLSGEDTIKHLTAAKGCKITLFADEKQFPELVSPVQMAFDTKGRLWVAAWPSYPELKPTDKVFDKLLILEDTDNDGKADKCTTFLDGLNCPTGFQFYKDGVLVMQAPDVWFVRDTNGDGKADTKERVLMGMDSADSHHTTNAMSYEPGGAIFLSDGVFHRTQVETAWGPIRNSDGCIYRFEPRTGRLERYTPYGFANPHGHVFDYWGDDIITDATGNANYFAPAFSGHVPMPNKHTKMKEFWKRPSRPCPGTGILSSGHFPEEFQGNFLNLNVIGFQGIFRAKMSQDGAGLKGENVEDLVKADISQVPNFRPSAIDVAPDGSLYFLDWAKELIGHMQHHIRDPNRDKQHGRVYRITYEGRPLLTPAKIDGEPIEKLLAALKTTEDSVRTRAKIELSKHNSAQVAAATKKWAASLDKLDPNYEHHMMEALWVHQWQNVVDEDLLKRMLKSPEPRARAAATRVLCYWRDRVKNPLDLLAQQIKDKDPRVRLHTIRACSFFPTSKAAEIAIEAAGFPDQETDYYLKYTLDATLKTLESLK
ncbi:MAG: azurin [Pedosphaera sp.]|nr:azurin [Pedosphaera sp.]